MTCQLTSIARSKSYWFVLVLMMFCSSGIPRLSGAATPEENALRGSAGSEAFTEPFETTRVAASETGIVSKVNIKRGDIVQKNDLLFELDMRLLEAAHRVAQVKANASARRKAAEAELDSKTKRYQKLVELFNDNAGSPEEVEKAKTEAEIAKQNVLAIVEQHNEYSLEAKRIETQMEQRRVRAPLSGVVVDVRKKQGEHVSNADPHLATIVKLEKLRVVFYLPTSQAMNYAPDDVGEILLIDTRQHARGIVKYVAPITNADSGRVRIEMLVDNQNDQYRSGLRCRLLGKIAPGKVIHPVSHRIKSK